MFWKKDRNFISDDELDPENREENIFTLLFKKDDTPKEKKEDTGVDFDNKFANQNDRKSKNVDFSKIIERIMYLVIFIALLVFLVPKIANYYDKCKSKYVSTVLDMKDQVAEYYDKYGQGCTTSDNNKYYFGVSNSKDIFGDKYVSPLTRMNLQGFIEIEVDNQGNKNYYVSFTDGVFGFERVSVDKLDKSDIGIYSFSRLERHDSMKCSKEFVFSK